MMDKFIEAAKEKGKAIDNWVEQTAVKHGFPKWKVWLGFVIAALAVVGTGCVVVLL